MGSIFTELDYYVDGAASNKTECGGWACITVYNGEAIQILKGCEKHTTNNRMELMAFLKALEEIKTQGLSKATIYCDSAYVVNCFNDKWYEKWLSNNWRTSDRQHVKNKDLWKPILNLYFEFRDGTVELNIVKVQSHTDNKFNNYADLIAVKERKNLELKEGF